MEERCENEINGKRCKRKAIVRDILNLYNGEEKLEMEVPLKLCKKCLPKYNLELYKDFEGNLAVKKLKQDWEKEL